MKKLITICVVAAMTSVAYALPSDDFNDNSMNTSMWNLFESDPCNEWLDETNHRLEMRSTADANDTGAVYFANGWGFSTMNNFSFKADFHNSFTSDIDISTWANVMLGLTKGSNLAEAKENFAIIQAAWDTGFSPPSPPPYSVFDYASSYAIDGNESSFQEQRDSIDGTLYVSYDAGADELYLSHIGYWKTNASGIIPGLLKGEWGSASVSLFLGGSTDVSLDSGVAYLDNFVVDSGTIVPICEYALAGDLNNDCKVDLNDFAIMASNWLIDCTTNPENPACVHK